MSENIIIQQSGLPEALTVDALRTSKLGGSYENWLTADGKNLVELDIGGSGTYRASDYNAYGIAMARVSPKVGGGATSKAAQQPGFKNLHIPSIQEGGLPVLLSARMVETNLQGDGTCLWVPEDEVNLDTKYVDHSGIYRASADNCYGYSQITVSGVDVEITTDDDGDDVAEITDGGKTETKKLPDVIVVTVAPNKINYYDGDSINYTGMVVKAYTRSGRLWTDETHPDGIIPISELTLPAIIAHADVSRGASSDLNTGAFTQPIPLSSVATYAFTNTTMPIRYTFTWTPINGAVMVIQRNTEDSTHLLWASATPGEVGQERYVYINERTGEQTTRYSRSSTTRSYTANGKTVYYLKSYIGHSGSGKDYLVNPSINNYGDDSNEGPAAWTAIYGVISGGTQEVPVQWNRPYDAELLETSFTIFVD